MKSFSFKTIKPTGKYRSFGNDFYQIKLGKKVVGSIDPEHPYSIRLMVVKDDINEDGNPNCIWKWVKLSKKSSSVEEAKSFVKDHSQFIQNKLNLYLIED